MKPTQPNFITTPFAQGGEYFGIQETHDGNSASWSSGFPYITEVSTKNGGELPKRKDFNGIFRTLSFFDHFIQSGERFTYSNKLDYAPPCAVYYNGIMWWCKKSNGVTGKIVTPGSNSSYWVSLIEFLKGNAENVGIRMESAAYPVGTILPACHLGKAPDEGEWVVCDGANVSSYGEYKTATGRTTVPNYLGVFLRGAGSQALGGTTYSAASLDNVQTDAMRNITGQYLADDAYKNDIGGYTSGAFYIGDRVMAFDWESAWKANGYLMKFDASRTVPTASENRPVNKTVWYICKIASEGSGYVTAPKFTVTIKQSANQTVYVKANGKTYTSSFTVEMGTSYTAWVTAGNGYTAGTVSSTSGTVNQNITIYASAAEPNVTAGETTFTFTYQSSSPTNYLNFTIPANVKKVRTTVTAYTRSRVGVRACYAAGTMNWTGDLWAGGSLKEPGVSSGETHILNVTAGKAFTLRGYGWNYNNSGSVKKYRSVTLKIEWSQAINKLTADRSCY